MFLPEVVAGGEIAHPATLFTLCFGSLKCSYMTSLGHDLSLTSCWTCPVRGRLAAETVSMGDSERLGSATSD